MSKQCRLCAKFTESVIDLFLEHETTLLTKINSFLPIKISKAIGLPTKICCKCVERCNATHCFIQEILLAQAVFGIPNPSPVAAKSSANSVLYGGITISSSNTKAIRVPTATKKVAIPHKRPQNVTETLKKLTKMQTGMTISKTVVPTPKAVRRCKAERKFYGEQITDDQNGQIRSPSPEDSDDDYYDPSQSFDVKAELGDNDSDSIHSVDDDDDDDYSPLGKKPKIKATSTVKQSINHRANNANTSDANSKYKAIKISSPPIFLCMKCKSKFETLADLKAHVFQKNSCSTSQLTCQICNKTFETRKRLSAHAKSHEEKAKYICDKCGKIYSNQFNLENHKTSQHGEYLDECQNVYKCRICAAKFNNRTDLYSHMKTHTKDKQELLCDICGKKFSNPHNLSSHKRIHFDIRPFCCELCPKRFRTRLLLRQHLHVHTGIKEFQCVHCLQSFAKQDSLRSHLKKRHPDAALPAPAINKKPTNQSDANEQASNVIPPSIDHSNTQSNSADSTESTKIEVDD